MARGLFILIALVSSLSVAKESGDCGTGMETLVQPPLVVRFFTKPSDPNTSHYVPARWGSPKVLWDGVRNAWRGFNDIASLSLPIRYISKGIWGHPRVTRLWFAIPMQMWAYGKTSTAVWNGAYDLKIWLHRDSYDRIIRTDSRFIDIRDALAANEISVKEARRFAFQRQNYIKQYFTDLRPLFKLPLTPELRQQFLLSPLFLDQTLVGILLGGVTDTEGFKVPEWAKGPVSPEKLDAIIEARVKLYDCLKIIEDMIYPHENMNEVRNLPNIVAQVEEIKQSEFGQALFALKDRGTISKEDLLEGLLDNEQWKTLISTWSILEMEPDAAMMGDMNEDGVFNVTDLQLLRAHTLKEKARAPKP